MRFPEGLRDDAALFPLRGAGREVDVVPLSHGTERFRYAAVHSHTADGGRGANAIAPHGADPSLTSMSKPPAVGSIAVDPAQSCGNHDGRDLCSGQGHRSEVSDASPMQLRVPRVRKGSALESPGPSPASNQCGL
jgi:hypothetical protein